MLNRQGGFSVFRLGLLAGLIGLVVIAIGVGAFFTDQNSRRAPFNIDPPPGAMPWGSPRITSPTARSVFFRVDNTDPSVIVPYYNQRMEQHYGGTGEQCVRIPGIPSTVPGQVTIPYQYVCMFDNSGMNSTQFTRVVIYPGVANEDPFFNAEGATVIEYEQEWQP